MGDTLTLQVGRRLTEDGYTFWQNTPFDPDALEQLDGTQTRTYTAVSYTHLDVYKRQAPEGAPPTGGPPASAH